MRANKIHRRKTKGVGLVESIVMAIVLIPVTLFFLDLIVLVLANSINDSACKNAARVAANQKTIEDAAPAAEKAVAAYSKNSIIRSLKLLTIDYDEANHTNVKVTTQLKVHMPIPFPGYSDFTFLARDVEPILVK
ncbi:MAG: hypothetical protein JST89_00375 [Cyanobacteria bacterium SZAS-4]|nr:hypothetical protein [Cyanobacteria bacterium SZAS-4]